MWNVILKELKGDRVIESPNNPKSSGQYICTCIRKFNEHDYYRYLRVMEYDAKSNMWCDIGNKYSISHTILAWKECAVCQFDDFLYKAGMVFKNQHNEKEELERLREECILEFKKIFNEEPSEKFLQIVIDVIKTDSNYPSHNSDDVTIGIFNAFNSCLANNLSSMINEDIIANMDKDEDNEKIEEIISNVNYKVSNGLLEYGEDFESLIISRLNTDIADASSIKAVYKSLLVEIQKI